MDSASSGTVLTNQFVFGIVPMTLVGLLIIVLIAVKTVPWIFWRLKRPKITRSEEHVHVSYEISVTNSGTNEADDLEKQAQFREKDRQGIIRKALKPIIRSFSSNYSLSSIEVPVHGLRVYQSCDSLVVQSEGPSVIFGRPSNAQLNGADRATVIVGTTPIYQEG